MSDPAPVRGTGDPGRTRRDGYTRPLSWSPMLLLLFACSLDCLVKDDVAIVCLTGVTLQVTDGAGDPVPAYTVEA